MKNRALIFALCYLSYFYYLQRIVLENRPLKPASSAFHVPRIIHQSIPDSIHYLEHYYLEDTRNVCLGKFKWCDELIIPENIWNNPADVSDFIEGSTRYSEYESLETNGFGLYPDYSTTIYYTERWDHIDPAFKNLTYYPVYVVNENARPLYFNAKDSYVYAIQEAKSYFDPEGADLWYPIECRPSDFCGNGQYIIRVNPGEFLLFIMPKYAGKAMTWIRVRLQNGNSTIVSRPFYGLMNPNQFYAKPDDFIQKQIKDNNSDYLNWKFLGSVPKAVCEKEMERS